jgi:hypothetical protein
MIKDHCIIGRETLPALPCNSTLCPWFVSDEDFANCFWVVAEFMYLLSGTSSFSETEIAKLENVSEDEVESILAKAMKKIRVKFRTSLTEY